jgi:tetratricopeptide (TPR) repeat protein
MSDVDDAQALLERARAFGSTGRYGDAVAGFDQLIARFGDSADPEVDWVVAEALFAKGLSLTQVERDEQATQVFEQMAARYRNRPGFEGHLSRALVQQASTLNRLDRLEDALVVYDEVLSTFSDAMEPPLAMGVAFAYLGKAGVQRRLDRLDDALETYDDLVIRFSDSPFPVLRQRVDLALSEKVFVLLIHGRYDEGIVVANAAVERLGQAGDSDALAIAVLNLGGALANEQRFDEAIDVYDLLIDQLADAELPVLRGRRILAISNKVDALVALEREDEAAELHNEMLERYGIEVPAAFADAAARNQYDEGAKAVVATMLLKQALALADLDRTQQARVAVDDLIDRFGGEPGDEFARVLETAREFREQLPEDED